MTVNRRFLLARRPHGTPVPDDFSLVEEAVPAAPEGGFVVRNCYASLDPAQRGWMDDAPSYMPPIPLGDPVRATTIGVIAESKSTDFENPEIAASLRKSEINVHEHSLLELMNNHNSTVF